MAFHAPIATGRSNTGIPTGRLAVWWLLASEVFIFGGLIASYLLHRLNNENWGEIAANTSTPAGALNTFVLLTSSLFIVLAHAASERKDIARTLKFIWLTIGCGGIFLVVKAYEYTTEISHGFVLTSNVFWSFYYTATALHACHVIAGMFIMWMISHDVKISKNLHRVELIGIYWHFVDLVWIFLFPLLYIAK
ncbi:MAG: cytochrome c oxidase subunit 3 [SAR324 cluster bacterium]|nr:cytochrome c oxidase subunit 3 [SAR324 cluster bacterium]